MKKRFLIGVMVILILAALVAVWAVGKVVSPYQPLSATAGEVSLAMMQRLDIPGKVLAYDFIRTEGAAQIALILEAPTNELELVNYNFGTNQLTSVTKLDKVNKYEIFPSTKSGEYFLRAGYPSYQILRIDNQVREYKSGVDSSFNCNTNAANAVLLDFRKIFGSDASHTYLFDIGNERLSYSCESRPLLVGPVDTLYKKIYVDRYFIGLPTPGGSNEYVDGYHYRYNNPDYSFTSEVFECSQPSGRCRDTVVELKGKRLEFGANYEVPFTASGRLEIDNDTILLLVNGGLYTFTVK